MAVVDPSLGLPAFLTHFDSLEFNNLPESHFHHFGPPYASFLWFFVLAEGLPLLKGLFRVHGDFTSRFRGGVFLGNILMEFLYAVLVSLKDTPFDSLFEKRLLELGGEGGRGGVGSYGGKIQPFLLIGVPLVSSSCPFSEENYQGP